MTGGGRVSLSTNLPSLAKALEDVAAQYPKETRAILREEVKQVAAVTRRNIRSDVGESSKTRRKARRTAGLSVSKTRATSAPTYGATSKAAWVGYNRRNRYIGWLDFGGTLKPTRAIPPRKRGRTNRIERAVDRPGRYLYPAINEQKPKTAERLARELDTLMSRRLPH